jgi:hypothetical protein
VNDATRKLPKTIFAKFYISKKRGIDGLSSAESLAKLLWSGEIIEVGEYRLVRSGYHRLVSGRASRLPVREVKKVRR